jgi:hypothetical protein
MTQEVSSDNENDGQASKQWYTAFVFVRDLPDGLELVCGSLWKGSQNFPSLEGMINEVYKDREEICEAIKELVNTNKVRIKFLPYPYPFEW